VVFSRQEQPFINISNIKETPSSIEDVLNSDFDTDMKILKILMIDDSLTSKALAGLMNYAEITIKRRLKKLQDSGKLQRIGSTKSGIWLVNK
jgi:predicted HTH transcriptional regulator